MNKIINLEYGGLSKEALFIKLSSFDIQLNEYANQLFLNDLFIYSNEKKQISVVITKIKDLSFKKGATIPQIQEVLKNYSLSECPLEVAPYLRLLLKEQEEVKEKTINQNPKGSLTIFSKPLINDDNFPKGFYLRKIDGKLCLRGYRCSLDYLWDPEDELIFKLIK